MDSDLSVLSRIFYKENENAAFYAPRFHLLFSRNGLKVFAYIFSLLRLSALFFSTLNDGSNNRDNNDYDNGDNDNSFHSKALLSVFLIFFLIQYRRNNSGSCNNGSDI